MPNQKSKLAQEDTRAQLNTIFQAAMRKMFRPCFPQERTFSRFAGIVTAILSGVGPKTITSTISLRGKEQRDWSGDYKVFSKSPWNAQELFRNVVRSTIQFLPESDAPLVLAIDDTCHWRWSHKIQGTAWHHDPLAPKYFGLITGGLPPLDWGHQMLHAALIIPPLDGNSPTAIAVAYDEILGKPKKKKKRKAEQNLSSPRKKGRPKKESTALEVEVQVATMASIKTPPKATELAVDVIHRVRSWLDEFGLRHRDLLVIVDASYCNGTVIGNLPDRTELVGRTRLDANLNAPLLERDGKRIYGKSLPTPKQISTMEEFPCTEKIFQFGGDKYPLRWKEVSPVLWKNGTRGRQLRLLVTQPVPHGRGASRGYRRYGHLLTTDLARDAQVILQAYLYRVEIENLHRIYKTTIGIGQTQCLESSPRIFAGCVATWALFSLVCRGVDGEVRGGQHPALSKWQANKRAWREAERMRKGRPLPVYRPTAVDNITLLRSSLGLRWQDGILRKV